MRSIKIFCKPAKDTYVFGSRFSTSFPAALLLSCFAEIGQQNDSMCQPAIGRLGLVEYTQDGNMHVSGPNKRGRNKAWP
jgi:hypothetical protein